MPARGFSIDVPDWWLEDLESAVTARKWTRTDLAECLIPSHPPLHGDRLKKAIGAARVKVTRFFDENKDTRVRTAEVVRAWSAALGLLPFEHRADTREQARAMKMAKDNPAQVLRAVAASQVAALLESGEARLEDLLAGRQPDQVGSGHGAAVRRGSRSTGDRATNPTRERG